MRILFPAILCLLITACDGGLAPPPPMELGFSGTIYFSPGTWPPPDSLLGLWVFASKVYPLDSAKVMAGLFQNPQTIFLYPGLNQSLSLVQVDSLFYSFPLRSGSYKYVGIIQQVNPNFSTQGIRVFRVVGFYKDSVQIFQPGSVEVNDIEQTRGINIDVDFYNPPPQPF